MKWPSVPVSEIAKQVRGVSYDKSQVSNNPSQGLIPILRAGNIQDGALLLNQDLVFAPESCVSSQQLLRPGDIVVAASSGSLDVVGKAAQIQKQWQGSFGAFCKVVRPASDRIDPRYLHHFFQSSSYRRKVSSLAAGANINNLKNEHIDDLEIPLPPLEEQRRVAAILDNANELTRLRSCHQALSRDVEVSIFYNELGSPASNPFRWPMVPLAEMAATFSDGPFGSNLKSSHYADSGIRVVRLQNIGAGVFLDDDRAYVSPSHYETIKKHSCLPGDVLIGTLGDPNLRACILPSDIPVAINKADCIQMRCDKTRCIPEYVSHLLNLPETNQMASTLILGQTRGRISMGRLKGLEVPIPPLEKQVQFAKKMDSLNSLGRISAFSASSLRDLVGSLSSAAFSL